MLQLQEVWTFYCWLPWSSEGEVKGQDKEIKFNSRKFRKQIKKSLMATWEDLDSESGSEKEEAVDEANVDVGLVATLT